MPVFSLSETYNTLHQHLADCPSEVDSKACLVKSLSKVENDLERGTRIESRSINISQGIKKDNRLSFSLAIDSHVAPVVTAALRYQKYPRYPSHQYVVDLEAIDENATNYDHGMERKKFHRKCLFRCIFDVRVCLFALAVPQ